MKRRKIIDTEVTTKKKAKKLLEQKKTIMVKKQRKIGMGQWDVTLESLNEITSNKGMELIRAKFKDINEGKTGECLIKKESNQIDMMIDSYWDIDDEEVDLMELIGEKFTINVVEKEGYLNLITIEAFEEYENEEIDEVEELELEITDEDLEIIEIDEDPEGFDIDDILE